VTRDSRYTGLLPAAELLSVVAERNLAEARDQNPLTRLPGNMRVAEVIARKMDDLERRRFFVYFDFDNFKPFNDRYGLRSGDRVIQLFADILRGAFGCSECFIGHLGGDDFFAFSYAPSADGALAPVREAAARFRREAASFYSAEDRDQGWIIGRDRSEIERRMPPMTVSAAVVLVFEGAHLDPDSLSDLLASLKKEAKSSVSHIALKCIEAAGSRDAGRTSPAFSVFAPALHL
jgi:diguanylate cyclase (GGDEF)-like protein